MGKRSSVVAMTAAPEVCMRGTISILSPFESTISMGGRNMSGVGNAQVRSDRAEYSVC